MLSIVICSVNTGFLEQVKKNIQDTIGIPYELLVWDNRQAGKGLCEVYNNMAAQAQYPYICFIHEDVLIGTTSWGKLLTDVFEQDPGIGLIGLAGTKYKSRTYAGWYCGHTQLDCMHITHRTAGVDHLMICPENSNQQLHEVVCIDGVFMVARKSVWEKVRFDDVLLTGFHVYDIDFSVRASQVCKVVVIMNIDLVHITAIGGDYSDNWVRETIKFHQHRKNQLPVSVKGLTVKDPETHIAKVWMDTLKVRRISWRHKMKWIFDQQLYKKPGCWYAMLKFLLYQPLGLKTLHHLIKGQ